VLLNTSAVLGDRNSVQFDRTANIPDALSYTTELRLSHRYPLLKLISTLAGGIQVMNNNMSRQQLGKGTTGSDFDLSLSVPGFGRDLRFETHNIAVFIENNFRLTEKLSKNQALELRQVNPICLVPQPITAKRICLIQSSINFRCSE
jgi:Fe(3+) dicitrate transport protein